MLRSPDMAISMNRAFLSSICQFVASTLVLVRKRRVLSHHSHCPGFNATLALLNMRGKPGDVEVMKSHEAALGVDACVHGLGRTNEDADAAGVEVGEELLFGVGLLVILHESDLGRRDAELDETGLDPTVGGKATRPLDIERAEVGKDHLSAATQSVGMPSGLL